MDFVTQDKDQLLMSDLLHDIIPNVDDDSLEESSNSMKKCPIAIFSYTVGRTLVEVAGKVIELRITPHKKVCVSVSHVKLKDAFEAAKTIFKANQTDVILNISLEDFSCDVLGDIMNKETQLEWTIAISNIDSSTDSCVIDIIANIEPI